MTTNKIIEKTDFPKFIEGLIAKKHVVGVQEKENGKFWFADLKSANDLRLDYDVTLLSPKKFIQPQHETLLRFKVKPKVEVEPVIETEELVLVGVHPYDMHAINQMDKLFSEDYKDTNYLARREKTIIIGCDPVKASKWSFWASMGSSTVEKGFDLWLTDLGDKYYVAVGTKKGKSLLKLAKTRSAKDADDIKLKPIKADLNKLCEARKITCKSKDLTTLFASKTDDAIWEERAKKCYSCGSCNLVCPTCYCFDVREDIELSLAAGKRIRTWDGCMLEEFASVASGENFREERADRFKHRLFRKMVYMPEKIGELACVGCGRCSSVCLPDIADPVKIINELKG